MTNENECLFKLERKEYSFLKSLAVFKIVYGLTGIVERVIAFAKFLILVSFLSVTF